MAKTPEAQAEANRLFDKASLVAHKLGGYDDKASMRRESYDRDYKTIVHTFNDAASSLKVSHTHTEDHGYSFVKGAGWDVFAEALVITYKGQEVFKATGPRASDVQVYVPGNWEKNLATFHLFAQQVLVNQRAAIIEKRVRAKTAL